MKVNSYWKAVICIYGVLVIFFGLTMVYVKLMDNAERETKLSSMSSEDRAKFLKKEKMQKELEEWNKKFKENQYIYGRKLKKLITESANDPDSLVFKEPTYNRTGVCIKVNGKNLFGAYVGFKEYCYTATASGEWEIQQP